MPTFPIFTKLAYLRGVHLAVPITRALISQVPGHMTAVTLSIRSEPIPPNSYIACIKIVSIPLQQVHTFFLIVTLLLRLVNRGPFTDLSIGQSVAYILLLFSDSEVLFLVLHVFHMLCLDFEIIILMLEGLKEGLSILQRY